MNEAEKSGEYAIGYIGDEGGGMSHLVIRTYLVRKFAYSPHTFRCTIQVHTLHSKILHQPS